MTIFRLVQTSLNNGKLTDFKFPYTLGYFTRKCLAEERRNVDIINKSHSDVDRTSTADYDIQPITVVE